jgi:hypothetical protein
MKKITHLCHLEASDAPLPSGRRVAWLLMVNLIRPTPKSHFFLQPALIRNNTIRTSTSEGSTLPRAKNQNRMMEILNDMRRSRCTVSPSRLCRRFSRTVHPD